MQAESTHSKEEEQFTEQHLQKFNEICQKASQLAQDYQKQSQQLKQEIVGMVSIYNQNKTPDQAVPVEKIVQITTEYQQGMREVQGEYSQLSQQLKRQEEERNAMMQQINLCFSKLQKMEAVLKEKQRRKQQAATQKTE